MANSDVRYSSVRNEGNPFTGHHTVTIEDDELDSDSDNDDAPQNSALMIQVDTSKSRWNHIEDLDSFFTRTYTYYQKSGYSVMMLQKFLELGQFVFVVLFVTYLIHGVNYSYLFRKVELPDGRTKFTLNDVMYTVGECISSITAPSWIILFIALLFWLSRAFKEIYQAHQYYDIKKFYNSALNIADSQITDLMWHEVQKKILEVQSEQQMCIHKEPLTQLDIYHRILRFKNYMVALMNKNLLPIRIWLPIIGDWVCFSRGLRYNIEMILFRGPWAAFENNWHLKEEFKRSNKRNELAQKLSRQIFWVAIANLLLSPLVFLWSLMVFFFSYADLIKREPGVLGTRCWSQYGLLYMRHFNELDHELHARLNRAYKPAVLYMSSFPSPLMAVIGRNVVFMCGGPLVIFVLLTVYDEDVVQVEHVLMILSILGAMVAVSRVFIPDENMNRSTDILLKITLGHLQYMPETWRGQELSSGVRDQFGQFFQLRALYFVNELLSPLTTPFMLMFYLRPRSLDIVDFFRNFTVSVVGVGDVCSFAQMDVRKHGNQDWQPTHSTDAEIPELVTPLCETNQYTQGDNGKTELSLIHFAITNPDWKMPNEAKQFMHSFQRHAIHDIERSRIGTNTAMDDSLYSVGKMGGKYSSIVQSIKQGQKLLGPNQMESSCYSDVRNTFSPTPNYAEQTRPAYYERTNASVLGASMGMSMIGGATQRNDKPRHISQDSLLYSICGGDCVSETTDTEFAVTDMCLSTLYLHDLHKRQIQRRTGTTAVRPDPGISWQQPHQMGPLSTDVVGFNQPGTSLSVAVERTPLLAPKKS